MGNFGSRSQSKNCSHSDKMFLKLSLLLFLGMSVSAEEEGMMRKEETFEIKTTWDGKPVDHDPIT